VRFGGGEPRGRRPICSAAARRPDLWRPHCWLAARSSRSGGGPAANRRLHACYSHAQGKHRGATGRPVRGPVAPAHHRVGAPAWAPKPATVIRMQVQLRNGFSRSQQHRQLQLCVPLVSIDGPSYQMRAISNAAPRCAAPCTQRPNHDHRQLRRLRHRDHGHHPQPQPPLLLHRAAEKPPGKPATAAPARASATTSPTPSTTLPTPFRPPTASPDAPNAATNWPSSPSSSPPTPPTSNPRR
jgi:hypothetical protein